MTFLSSSVLIPLKRGTLQAPNPTSSTDFSIVIPVRNNAAGVHRLLTALLEMPRFPREVIVVDNSSYPPLEIAPHFLDRGLNVRLLTCPRPGPARARNVGWQAAQGDWILFLDSDCIPFPNLLDAYIQAANGSIAYAGWVTAASSDALSHYYEQQNVLIPPASSYGTDIPHPNYIITANALVWHTALVHTGGFNERFPSAAGEDVDLGLRLWEIGPISFAFYALVTHTFTNTLQDFCNRFIRYGRGNRLLARLYNLDLQPRPFVPARSLMLHRILALLQFLCLYWGYTTTYSRLPLRRTLPYTSLNGTLSSSSQLLYETTQFPIALFIDADNMPVDSLDTVYAQEQQVGGKITIGRIYRTVHNQQKRDKWAQASSIHKLSVINVTTKKKNAVDDALITDLNTILQTSPIRHVWLVSNDGGYAPFIQKLVNNGYTVRVFGSSNMAKSLRKVSSNVVFIN